MCLICMQLDKMEFNEAYNELNKIPDGFFHKSEVERLIKEKFKDQKDTIRLDTLRQLANKYYLKKDK